MVENGQKDSPKYEKLCAEVLEKRERKKEKPVQLAGEMLKLLIEAAETHGVKLGIENREALEEIPLDSDFNFFFKDFVQPTVGYWHDTGHAQIKENLGLFFTPCNWNRWQIAYWAFTFMMSSSRRATTARPVPG
jgi:sugar phosphate isomerase/epimerase